MQMNKDWKPRDKGCAWVWVLLIIGVMSSILDVHCSLYHIILLFPDSRPMSDNEEYKVPIW